MFTNRNKKSGYRKDLGELSRNTNKSVRTVVRDYGNRHPYTRPEFWYKNRFWLRGGHSKVAIKYFNEWLETL